MSMTATHVRPAVTPSSPAASPGAERPSRPAVDGARRESMLRRADRLVAAGALLLLVGAVTWQVGGAGLAVVLLQIVVIVTGLGLMAAGRAMNSSVRTSVRRTGTLR